MILFPVVVKKLGEKKKKKKKRSTSRKKRSVVKRYIRGCSIVVITGTDKVI